MLAAAVSQPSSLRTSVFVHNCQFTKRFKVCTLPATPPTTATLSDNLAIQLQGKKWVNISFKPMTTEANTSKIFDDNGFNLARLCAQYFSPKSEKQPSEKGPSMPWIPDMSIQISSAFVKNFSTYMGQTVAGSNSEINKKNTYISNIYLMLSMLISTLSVMGMQTRILPLIFGPETGNIVDFVYKGALTVAAMTLKVHTLGDLVNMIEFDIPDMTYTDKNAIANQEYQKAGSPGLLALSVQELKELHDRIRANLETFLNAAAQMA